MITAVPADTPVTTPVEEPTVATEGLPDDHTPPPGELAKAMLDPTHTWVGPVIAAGIGSTVTLIVAKHPVDNV